MGAALSTPVTVQARCQAQPKTVTTWLHPHCAPGCVERISQRRHSLVTVPGTVTEVLRGRARAAEGLHEAERGTHEPVRLVRVRDVAAQESGGEPPDDRDPRDP